MSQVIKHQEGSGPKGIQPGAATPSQPLYNFKVNGNDYKMSEQAIRDNFDGYFNDLVQKREAHEKDRDKWVGTYNRLIDNVKRGQYELTSSNGHLYQGRYNGDASNSDLGLNADGSSARKTVVGNILGRANKSDAQRMSMLDHYFGNSVIGGYDNKVAADAKSAADAKAKLDAQAADNKKKKGEDALSAYQANQRGFGESQFGDNYRNPASRQMVIGDQYWGKNISDSQRYNMLLGHYSRQYKNMYDTTNDANLDPEALKKLKAQREMGLQFYDPSKGKFLTSPRLNHLDDFERLSNPFGLAGEDAPFYNKGLYDKMIGANGEPAKTDPNAPKPLTRSGELWTDGSQFWKDKDRKTYQTGFDKNGTLYDGNGRLFTGWSMHDQNPDSHYTGWYANGKRGDWNGGMNYMNALNQNPANSDRYNELKGQYSQILAAYDKTLGSPSWLKASDNKEQSDATYNVWAKYQKAGIAPQMTSDETAKYLNLGNRANIQMYTTQHMNDYGRPKIFRMITLPNHKQFKGNFTLDPGGNVTGMNDEDGKPIHDSDLAKAITGVSYKYDAANNNPSNTTYTGSAAEAANKEIAEDQNHFYTNPVAMQDGGSINNSQAFTNTQSTASKPSAPHEANVGDIQKSLSDPQYHLSGSDKAELAALGLNLGSLAASFTGVGSEAAAGLGAAATATQFGADVSREGLTLGNAGNALLGLGLDAASAIPGIGVWADSTKVGKTLAKTARYLIPAMTGIGMTKAAVTVADLASGKKKVSDLSMDDLRDLVNGIHGVVGGARYVTNRLGSTRSVTSSIKLADGTNVALDPAGEMAIKNADNPAEAAKSVVARLTGKSADEIKLAQRSGTQWGMNPIKTLKTWNSRVDDASILTAKGQVIPKNPADYQGGGMYNWLVRRSIPTVQSRLASAKGDYVVDPKYKVDMQGNVQQADPGVKAPSPWNFFGDYVQGPGGSRMEAYNGTAGTTNKDMAYRSAGTYAKNTLLNGLNLNQKALPSHDFIAESADNIGPYNDAMSKTVGDIPDTRRIFGTMFGMNKFDNERAVSYQQVRNRLKGLTGSASSRSQLTNFLNQDFEEGTFSKNIQDQIKQAMEDPTSRGYVKFKQGGRIPKFQGSGIITGKYLNSSLGDVAGNVNDLFDGGSTAPGFATDIEGSGAYIPKAYSPSELISSANNIVNASQPNSNQSGSGSTSGKSTIMGNVASGAGRGFNPPRFQINPAMASEFGRAIASSRINSMYDTRVERPMISAPQEVPVSVHGNLFAEAVANRQADNIVKGVDQFKTSDGTMQMLGNLEAQKQAADLRFQGSMQSNNMLNQTRQAALESAVKNAQSRMAAANENIHTNASATQAERQQGNLKRTMVAQPLLDFWQNANDRAQNQYQEGRDIDTKIAGLGEEQKVRVPMQQLQLAANNVWNDPTLTGEQRMAKYNDYMNAISTIQSRLSAKFLEFRKNPYSTLPGTPGYYTAGLNLEQLLGTNGGTVPAKATGGSMWRVQAASLRAQGEANRATAKENADEGKSVMDDETKKQISAMKGINDLIKMALK